MTAYLASHALTLASVVAWLVMLTRISATRRSPQSTFAWLLAFALVPLLAIPLYMALGSRKFPARAKGQRLAVPPIRTGNSFELLGTGEAAFERLLALVREAKRSIEVTVFILGDDATGAAIVAALGEASRRGVDVRVILDGVGSMSARRKTQRALQDAGARMRVFMPLRHSPVRGRTNLRSHRKMVVVDRERVFAGGMNFAHEYMGPPLNGGPPRWRDVAAVVSGPVVADASVMFESDWSFCGGEPEPKPDSTSANQTAPAGDATIQFVPSGPDLTTDTMYDVLLNGIFGARERIAIVTPYYVPDDALQHAVVLAARRGVKTELLVPAKSNHGVADVARRALLRELRANGVVIHYYDGMVHAKAMVIDDTFAYVGSPNFDMRSLFLNYEDALCVHSSAAIGQVRAYIDGLIADCPAAAPVFEQHRIYEQLAQLLAPEL